MNRFEKLAMNNPIRNAFLRRLEAPLLRELGGDLDGLTVLEIGCGCGVSTELIVNMFQAGHVTAIDVDPDMVCRA
ncbi:MAG: trans-aconitate 2-methyltransferase, partial [Gemmataceae bacterium]